MHLRNILAALLLLPMLTPAHAAAPDTSDAAFRRAPLLARGINLSNWFASSSDLSADHIAKHTTPADLTLIHDLGFTYVRLGVDPTQFTRWDADAALARLDTAINQVLVAKLAVSICIFPTDDYKRDLASEDGARRFIQLWRTLAHHYAASDPELVFFEVINEPQVTDAYRWDGLQAATIAAIRGQAPNHTIIATAARWAGLDDILRVEPVRDPNVIYNFHFYEPYPFTHQAANWGAFDWTFYKDVPYPATTDTIKAALANVPDASARYTLYLYAATGWNQQSILGRLQFARDWANQHHVPIICDEFGAYRDKAPADSRARYLHDVRSSLEQLHIGWAMWDYSGDFGIVTKQNDTTTPDPVTIEALGLHAR